MLAPSGIAPHVDETSSRDGARFDAPRWQALDHGLEAKINHGLDFRGKPRPLP